ncbi:CARDB domain-containing protein [Candidatus Uabimicrobium amorphum]|uniref:CARDB domain-containing protein n=1 Tax=Uabimicrobium amorphum TaxID=2596890 RepID=A0A5S9IRA6_UABAM|nr:CARDB domain-containing protein [Candidatus Uabimicrobium amorphum]BBM86683.1 hypothetical protein UABAM_05069 [Candidatus Uabimicrobium amorphum]
MFSYSRFKGYCLFLILFFSFYGMILIAETIPGPFKVKVVSSSHKNPLANVTVYIGGRKAVSDPAGEVVFDGLPEGNYQLRCDQPGFNHYEKQLAIPNGKRPPHTVILTPEVLTPLKLKLVASMSGESIPHARVYLTSVKVHSSFAAKLNFNPNWEGHVTTIPVPAGTYSMRIVAKGFKDYHALFVHKAVKNNIVIKLDPIFKPLTTAVIVKGDDGNFIGGANVELWESYPQAKIAVSRSNQNGLAKFSTLKLGVVNPINQDKVLSTTCRNEVVARVTAKGYHPTLQSLSLAVRNRKIVTLNKIKEFSENEPNNSKEQAQLLRPGNTVSLKIGKFRDQDWFSFQLKEPAQVTLFMAKLPIEISMQVMNAAGKVIGNYNQYAGHDIRWVGHYKAGKYFIRILEWGNNGFSPQEFKLKMTSQTAADPLEPNDNKALARDISVGQHMRGLIFPVGDKDFFRVKVDRPGRVQLVSMYNSKFERSIRVFNENNRVVGHLNMYTGHGGKNEFQIQPGVYYIEISEWGNNGLSLDPYDIRIRFISDDGIDDLPLIPGQPIVSLRHLELDKRIYGTINPVHDQDVYTIYVPSKGMLNIYQHGDCELSGSLYNAQGKLLRHVNSYAKHSTHMAYGFQRAQTVYYRMTEWGNNGWSPFPYELKTWFSPAAELERLQHNETMQTATPIELGVLVRDNIHPVGDQDWYQVTIDQPGTLEVWNRARPELDVRLFNAKGKLVGHRNIYHNHESVVNWNVLPGIYYIKVADWGNNGACAWDYAMKVTLKRAVPGETADMAKSPIVPLKIGEARTCGIEHVGDVERYRVSIPEKGEYALTIGGPLESSIHVKDIRTGKPFLHFNAYAGHSIARNFKTQGPMELLITVREWGNNQASIIPNWIMVAKKGVALTLLNLEWKTNPVDPTKVTFTAVGCRGVKPSANIALDINNDGHTDATLTKGAKKTLDFPKQGLYKIHYHGRNKHSSYRGEMWVQATGQPIRKGIHVLVSTPGEGQLIHENHPVRVTAISFEGKPITSVNLQVNGRSVGTDYTVPYEFSVPWYRLAGSECTLLATAVDSTGKTKRATRKVRVSDYFNLRPVDGAVITGKDVTISWDGGKFGSSRVKYRLAGDAKIPWQEIVGANGRKRQVRITHLEAGKVYQIQPISGKLPGPIRQVTRVKGLAFTESQYGGTIERDYDQKIPVSVRNHAAQKRIVRLRCELPRNSKLLAEFIGDGEKGSPVELAPGEQRTFLLGFSAQDVLKEDHTLPIFIKSKDGFSDQAQVKVKVRIPLVKLKWKDVTPKNHQGLGKIFELTNEGDTLTDLNVSSVHDKVKISPEMKHGLCKKGERLRFEVFPKLYEGFHSCKDQIVAKSIATSIPVDFKTSLKPGEKIYRINMMAGIDPVTGKPDDMSSAIRAARRIVGQYLDPAYIDWSHKTNPRDTNRDGKPDHWSVLDDLNNTKWFGQDTDGDSEIDFVQADVGMDGEIDHCSVMENGKWKPTNMLDAWLEMNFSIPKHRTKYKKHDLDLVVNGKIVGQLQQQIPEGNYRFSLPATTLNWGAGSSNQLEINSRFLNYAHYAISSDFQLKTRLLNTDTFMVGTSRKDAVQRLYKNNKGFSTEAPDYSISSQDLNAVMPANLAKGAKVVIHGKVLNLGVSPSERLEIAMFLAVPGTKGKELTRQMIAPPGMMDETSFQFTWPASAGSHSLRIVVDPDNLLGESNRRNNTAIINVQIPGKDTPPVLTVIKPTNNFNSDQNVMELLANATDDAGIISIDVSVDNGAMKPLYKTSEGYAGKARLQPGSHTLHFQVTDSGGNRVSEKRTVVVAGKRPEFKVIHPKDQTQTDNRHIDILVSAENMDKVAVRVNNGPWQSLMENNNVWTGKVDLTFGECHVETVVVDSNGLQQKKKILVHCSAQPQDQDKDDTDKGNDENGKKSAKKKQQQKNNDDVNKNNKHNNTKVQHDKKDKHTPHKSADQHNKEKDKLKKPAQQNNQIGGKGRKQPNKNDKKDQKSPQGKQNHPQGKDKDEDAGDGGSEDADDDSDDTPQAPTPLPVEIPEENEVEPPTGFEPPTKYRRPTYNPQRNPRRRPAPKGFNHNRQRKDWYCPNRPNIKTIFKVPEGMTKEEYERILKLGPDSKEFKELEAKLLAKFWYNNFGRKFKGKTMDKFLEQFRDLLLKRCDRLTPVDGKMPSFLQNLGFVAPDPPTDPAELRKWRERMKDLTKIYWLRLLASNDPQTVINGMRKRAKALQKYDEASSMQAEAIVDKLTADQQFAEEIIEALPYAGEVLDVYAIVTGRTALSGRQVDAFETVMRSLGVGIPAAQQLYSKGKALKGFANSFAEAYRHGGDEFKDALIKQFKKAGKELDPKIVDKAFDTINKFKKQGRNAVKKQMDEMADTAGDIFRKSDAGKAAHLRKAADEKQARELIEKLNKATDPDEIADLSKKLQHDKTAQRLINEDGVNQSVRDKMIDYLDDPTTGKGLYQKTDKGVKKYFDDVLKTKDPKKLSKMADEMGMTPKQLTEFQDDVQAFAKKHGLDVDDLEVDVVAPTNKKGGKRTVGRDRDVTYRVKIKDDALAKAGNPRYKTMDIDHRVSDNVYKKNLWEQAHPGQKLKNMDDAHKFADGMDQMVTSAKHHEAYDIGNLTVEEFFEGGLGNVSVTGKKQLNNFTETMKTKSTDWFQKTTGDAVKNTTEGMRQATKQYDKAITTRLKKYGMDPDLYLDPTLVKGKEIFDKVAKGQIPLEQGEQMLKAIGSSKEEVVEKLADAFKKIETSGPAKIFREQGEKKLRAAVQKQISNKGSAAAMEATVNALKNGEITGEAFKQIRSEIAVQMGKNVQPADLGRYVRKQIINTAEFNHLAKIVAKRTGRSIDEVLKEANQR